MKCQWGVLGVLAGFLSGVVFGTVVYRVIGGSDPTFLFELAAIGVSLGVSAVLA